ncbi:hypothetical protein TeGR_g4715, partial [Tetraparma gracilis]
MSTPGPPLPLVRQDTNSSNAIAPGPNDTLPSHPSSSLAPLPCSVPPSVPSAGTPSTSFPAFPASSSRRLQRTFSISSMESNTSMEFGAAPDTPYSAPAFPSYNPNKPGVEDTIREEEDGNLFAPPPERLEAELGEGQGDASADGSVSAMSINVVLAGAAGGASGAGSEEGDVAMASTP